MSSKPILITVCAVAGVWACKGKSDPPAPSTKEAPVKAVDEIKPAAPPPAAPPPAATTLGPIDLAAKTLDLAALFPGDTLELEKAAEAEGSTPGSPDEVLVHRTGFEGTAGNIAAIVSLDGSSNRVTRIEILAPGMKTPRGVEVGAKLGAVAQAVPAATCDWGGGMRGMLCSADADPFTYQFDTTNFAEDGETSISKGPPDADLGTIIWDAPEGAGPMITARPGK